MTTINTKDLIGATPRAVYADEQAAFEAVAKADTSNVSFIRDDTGYVDMTAALLWHGWKLRASHGQAPSQAVPQQEALRLAKYVARRKLAKQLDANEIHSIDYGCDTEAVLLLSDIEAVLAHGTARIRGRQVPYED